jgi:hypothetical protein
MHGFVSGWLLYKLIMNYLDLIWVAYHLSKKQNFILTDGRTTAVEVGQWVNRYFSII